MDDLERAVAIMGGVVKAPHERADADKYLRDVLESEDAFRHCIPRMFKTNETLMHHFCLKTVEHVVLYRYLELSGEDRTMIHDALIRFYTLVGENADVDFIVREKLAQVIVHLFRLEYLGGWSNFFSEIRGPCATGNVSCLDLYQRILICIHDSVISSNCQHNMTDLATANNVKDKMREDCVEDVVSDWVSILKLNNAIELKKLALKALSLYIEWIDIGLVVNDTMMPLLYEGLRNEHLQKKACKCLHEIVLKGMVPETKLELLVALNLLDVIDELPVTDEKFAIRLAQLIDFVGGEAMGTLTFVQDDLLRKAVNISIRCVTASLPFFAHDNYDVSEKCVSLLETYVNNVKSMAVLNDDEAVGRIGDIVRIAHRKMAYPNYFSFEDKGEEEAEFLEYRNSVCRLFKGVVRFQPHAIMSYIYDTLSDASSRLETIGTAEMEVALYMLHIAVEDLPDRDQCMPPFLCMVVERNVIGHQSIAVPLMVMELLARCRRYIPRNEEFLSTMLQQFLGSTGSGLRHPVQRVRSRACYFFLALVKVLVGHLRQFVQPIIENVSPLLSVDSSETEDVIRSEDQCYLFETLGVLVAQHPANREKLMSESLGTVLNQAIGIAQEASQRPDHLNDPRFAIYMSRAIAVMAFFSKGFDKTRIDDEARPFFVRCLELAAEALRVLPEDQTVRGKSIFLLHRMIETLGTNVLEHIVPFMDHLLNFLPIRVPSSVMEYFQLVTQIVSRFKGDGGQLIDQLFLPMIMKTAPYFDVSCSLRTAEGQDNDMVQRQFYLLVRHLLENGLAGVLTSERNFGRFDDVIETILRPCLQLSGTSYKTKIVCVKTLTKMCSIWKEEEQFRRMMVERAFEMIFAIPMDNEFALFDSDATELLNWLCTFQYHAALMGEDVQQALRAFLSSKGLSQSIVSEYFSRLETGATIDKFAKWFKDLIRHLRSGG